MRSAAWQGVGTIEPVEVQDPESGACGIGGASTTQHPVDGSVEVVVVP